MNILGIHGGHDASVAVIKNGIISSFVMKERFTRVKHSSCIDKSTIEIALSDANIRIENIDFCAITSTQNKEIISLNKNYLKFSFSKNAFGLPCSTLEDQLKGKIDPIKNINYHFRDRLFNNPNPKKFPGYYYFPNWRKYKYNSLSLIGFIGEYIKIPEWSKLQNTGIKKLSQFKLNSISDWNRIRYGFHYPLNVYLGKRKIPGFMIHHHLAHAASSYYCSSYDNAAIISHDGGIDKGNAFNSGFFLLAKGNQLFPLMPHNLIIGHLYGYIGMKLGLGTMGQAGKLMGLSSYGNSLYFNKKYVGNVADFKNHGFLKPEKDWFKQCSLKALKKKLNINVPKSTKNIYKNKFCIDLSASTQKLFEETILKAIIVLKKLLIKNDLLSNNLILTGGIALNCPANSKIWESSKFKTLSISPWCNDTGLSLGAALYLYYNIMDNPLKIKKSKVSAYYGRVESNEQIIKNLKEHKSNLSWKVLNKNTKIASEDLANNKILGWFEGGSEMGPRALGHRSILVNPTLKNNINRLNKIKGREKWRPFGAMVLESELKNYFSNVPNYSPHMLFRAKVKNNKLPAITHIDGSSRVQTVTKKDGYFYNLLFQFYKLTAIPVLLNTSFNEAGEPIIETSYDAIKSFLKMNIDVLYLNTPTKQYQIIKK